LRLLERMTASGELQGYPRTDAARADLLRRAGRPREAMVAYAQAIAGCQSPWEAQALRKRAQQLEQAGST
ncbi:MAG TPA: RNA polymerase subunit sigma-24, partial [Myxococcales bacterium]|nr:RNA polymerase subunit sigma-24 [Myxococcales bacterium]